MAKRDDLPGLARMLGLTTRRLRACLGPSWWEESETLGFVDGEARPIGGQLYVGLAGPSVALRVRRVAEHSFDWTEYWAGWVDDAELPPFVFTVGSASGTWEDDWRLTWRCDDPVTVLLWQPAEDPRRFLAQLKSAVVAAAAVKAPRLVTCHNCGGVVAPECANGADTCRGCATKLWGIVY